MASTHKTLCDAVADAIVGMELVDYPNEETIEADRVLVRWGIDDEPVKLPAIFISPVGTVVQNGGTNERDDWVYPVTVYFVDSVSLADHEALDAMLEIRERISRKFVSQRLASAYKCEVQGSPVLDERLTAAFQILVEPIYLAFTCRELRG